MIGVQQVGTVAEAVEAILRIDKETTVELFTGNIRVDVHKVVGQTQGIRLDVSVQSARPKKPAVHDGR